MQALYRLCHLRGHAGGAQRSVRHGRAFQKLQDHHLKLRQIMDDPWPNPCFGGGFCVEVFIAPIHREEFRVRSRDTHEIRRAIHLHFEVRVGQPAGQSAEWQRLFPFQSSMFATTSSITGIQASCCTIASICRKFRAEMATPHLPDSSSPASNDLCRRLCIKKGWSVRYCTDHPSHVTSVDLTRAGSP